MKAKCIKCKKTKNADKFSFTKAGKPSSYCKLCAIENTNKWRKKNFVPKIRKKFQSQYERVLMNKYGLTWDDYMEMRKIQKDKCMICEEKTDLVVDHCHSTNKVRGLLCSKCNTLLGFARDNTTILRRSIRYLKDSTQ